MSPIPLQYQTLCDSSKIYEPGSQYAEYLRRLPKSVQPSEPEVFSFEPYVQGQRTSDESRKESFHSNGSVSDHHSPEGSPVASPKRDKYRLPVKAWGHQIPNVVTTSDTDSASCSSKSHESSPSGSPHRTPRRLVSSQSVDELTEEELIAAAAASQHTQDKRSQQMKRNLTVAGEDGLDIPSLLMHRGRRNTTFGVDFQEQVDAFQSKVPPIVSKCLSEIEKRGVMIKGIYRVSGVKSKVENLCQKFDLDPEGVDLSEIHPNVISNVLKLYLRQLPEPLLTFRLYSDFIHTAKENMSGQLLSSSLIDHLKSLVGKLPSSNLRTCAVLMHHLQRVASQSDFNQMSASNLGIVFGPTLLRPLEGSASLASLVDTPHQTRAIELLITYAHLIFGPSEDFELAPTQSPVEQLTQALDGILLPGQGHAKNSPCPIRKPQIQSTGSEDLPVFDPVAGSANQPWQCESVLPGTVSQESSDIQTVAGLNLDESELGSEECDDLPDIILPDQSKQLSDPLSVTLSVRCIQGIDQTSQHLSPSIKTSSGPYFKPSVTKSSSTPLISNKSSLTSSDMVVALTSSAAGMASMLIMSAGTFPAEDHVTNTPLIKETHLVDNLDKKGALDVSLVTAQELPGQEKDVYCESIESKKAQEEVSKKRLHSLQLENIKYLTQPATSQDVYTGPGLTLSDKPVTSQDVSPSLAHNAGQTLNQSDSKPTTYSTQPAINLAGSHATNESIVTESTHISVKASQSTRRSILEEMPIPTVSKPVSNVDVGADAVTIPASPTIKRREMPSKIPTSPGTQRSFDSRGNLEKVDSRADRFKQEQRKLVKAIKSDSKIGAVSSHSDSRLTSFDMARLSQESPEKETISQSSDIFENTLSGGCALSSRHSSQSEETTSELTVVDTKPASDTLYQSNLASQSTSSISSSKPLRSSTWTGKTESTKTVLISRQRPATSAGESSFLAKPASSRIKALNMPSTLYVKKPLLNMSTTKVSLSGTSVTATSTSVKSGSTRTSSTPKTSSDQSPQLCSRLSGNVKTSEEQSSVRTASVTRKGSGRGGELSVSIKSVKTKTDNEGGLERSSTSSSQSSSPRHRHPSGDSNHHTKQAQRRHASSSGSSPSFQDKIQLDKQTSGLMGVQQVQKTARSSSQSQSSSGNTMSSSSTSVSSSTIMQSSSSSSSSGKLSQDRTPRFV